MKAVFCVVLLALTTVAIAENSAEESKDKCDEFAKAKATAATTCRGKASGATTLMGQTADNAFLRRKRNIERQSRDAGSDNAKAEVIKCFENELKHTEVYKKAVENCKKFDGSEGTKQQRRKCRIEETCMQCKDLKMCSKQGGDQGGHS